MPFSPSDLSSAASTALFEAGDDPIIVCTVDGRRALRARIVAVNPAFTTMLGYSTDAVHGRSPGILAKRGTERQALRTLRTGMRRGVRAEAEICVADREGTPVWFRAKSVAVPGGAAAGPARAVLHLQPIDDRKALEAELLASVAAQEKAGAARQQFLSVISHELRTPLNAIIGFADVLESEAYGRLEDPMQRESVTFIRQGGRHLLSILNDLLEASAIEDGPITVREEAVHLDDVARQAIGLTSHRRKQREACVEAAIPDRLPRLRADGRRLTQALVNLVENALKYAEPAEGAALLVRIEARSDATGVTLTVRDNGGGIPEEMRAAVQRPFVQGEAAGTRHSDGVGLGLHIVRAIAAAHGGTLTLDRPPGGGTAAHLTFGQERLLLPARDAAAAEA